MLCRTSLLLLLSGLVPYLQAQSVPQQAASLPKVAPASSATDDKPSADSPSIISAIHGAGRFICGVVEPVDDWDGRGEHGNLASLGTAFCEAVAVVVLGRNAPVEVVSFPAETEAFEALKTHRVHLVAGLSPSAEAAMQYGVSFGRPFFFDTQRFLVPASAGRKSVASLRDNLICAMNNSPSEERLHDYMATQGIAYGLQAHSEQGEMDASVAVAHCAAGSALESRLAESRADFPANAPEFVFLPERFGLDPVVPAFLAGDQRFSLLVDMTLSALVEAEALGITQGNAQASTHRTDLRARRLTGADRSVGQALALPPDWAVPVLLAVGNYGEMYARTLGKAYHLERGPNALWLNGGLMAPSPLQ